MIQLLAYENEPGRFDRLRQVAQAISERANLRALHDYKGLLSVDWRDTPTTEAIVETAHAWASQGEHHIAHYVGGKLLLPCRDSGALGHFAEQSAGAFRQAFEQA